MYLEASQSPSPWACAVLANTGSILITYNLRFLNISSVNIDNVSHEPGVLANQPKAFIYPKYDFGYTKQTVDTRLLKHDSGQTTSCTEYLCFGFRLYSLWLNRWLRLLSTMLQTRLNGRSDLKRIKALLTDISQGQPLSPTRFRIQAPLRVLR